MLFNINRTNGDASILEKVQRELLLSFPKEYLQGAEFGVAFGGGIEQICRIWDRRGMVYGFDTFEGHPKQLAEKGTIEADCMEGWYSLVGKDKYNLSYITDKLRKQGLYHFSLEKGLITKDTVLPFDKVHYVLLDLDILQSMKDAYELVKDKIVSGGYLCLHDVIPSDHMPKLNEWWNEHCYKDLQFELISLGKYLMVYKKV